MADREPHEVLGVARDASEDEVRAAYREMVKKHHPDVSDAEDAEERFVNIRDAYEVMRERANGESRSGDSKTGNGNVEKNTAKGRGEPKRETRSSTRSEHKKRKREKRKRWDDPWKSETQNDRKRSGERRKSKKTEKERVERLGYGWTLFREDGKFSVSKSGGRGHVYIDTEGGMRRDKYLFSSREEAEDAYEEHVKNREERRNTFSLGGGWRMVQRASGYAVEGEEGYIGVDGNRQDKPYWFRSREEAETVYEAYVQERDEKKKTVRDRVDSDSLASRVTVGAALLPFLATITVLNVLSSSLGLGTKGKNPYLATALTSVFFGTLAVVLSRYSLVSYVLLFLAVWAGVEFTVMIAGPYTADEIEG